MDHQTAGLCASEEVSFAGRTQEIQHGQSETHRESGEGKSWDCTWEAVRTCNGSGAVGAASQGTACFKKAPHDINQTVDRRSTWWYTARPVTSPPFITCFIQGKGKGKQDGDSTSTTCCFGKRNTTVLCSSLNHTKSHDALEGGNDMPSIKGEYRIGKGLVLVRGLTDSEAYHNSNKAINCLLHLLFIRLMLTSSWSTLFLTYGIIPRSYNLCYHDYCIKWLIVYIPSSIIIWWNPATNNVQYTCFLQLISDTLHLSDKHWLHWRPHTHTHTHTVMLSRFWTWKE